MKIKDPEKFIIYENPRRGFQRKENRILS